MHVAFVAAEQLRTRAGIRAFKRKLLDTCEGLTAPVVDCIQRHYAAAAAEADRNITIYRKAAN